MAVGLKGDRVMAFRKMTVVAVIMLVVLSVLLTVSTMGVLGAPRGSGNVQVMNVGVYLDSDCTVPCTSIDWGHISAGGAVSKTIYVKNSGSSVVYLKISNSNWIPLKASSLMKLSWDIGNSYPLSVGEVVPVKFTLKAAANTHDLSDFSFTVVLTGVMN